MKTLFFYTLNTIRQNRRTSLSIMISVLLASTLLCAMCTYGYTDIRWRVDMEEHANGQWHGELGGEIPAQRLKLIDNNLYVDATMVKGPFTCLRLFGESGLPYLLLRDADENYWNLMGEKNAILEGRVPQRPGEIAVSKSFFEQNPHCRLGDTLTLPRGERRLGSERLDGAAIWQEGERFLETGKEQVTLVGKMDLTTNTTVPGYYAMGYLDREALSGQEELVVYVKLKDIRKTYQVMPRIAEELGIQKDEYGRYENHFDYHSMLLALNFVFPPETSFSLQNMGTLLVYGAILLLVMGAFAMIICGAFQVSAAARMKQLGMFRCVGATPGQIAASILMEGVILSVLPILLSLGIGYGFTVLVMGLYTDIAGEFVYFPVKVRFSPLLGLLCAGLSLITALVAASVPALKIARLSPLEAVRMQEGAGAKAGRRKRGRRAKDAEMSGPVSVGKGIRRADKEGISLLSLIVGFEGELARASHRAQRRAFRGGVLSLTFCLMLLTGFFSMMSLNDFLSQRNKNAREFNIHVRLDLTTETDRKLLNQILAVPGQEESVYYCDTRMAYWASPQEQTRAFQERGGFDSLNLNEWGIVKRDGKYRIRVYLFGMQEEKFDEYCRRCGADPTGFYDTEKVRAVALSAAPLYPEVVNNEAKSRLSYSHLKLAQGQELRLLERTEDSMDTDCEITLEAGALAQEGPQIGDVRNNYTISLYMPLSVYYSVARKLSGQHAGNYYTFVKIRTTPDNDIPVTEQIEKLCGAVMAKEDFVIVSDAREEENNAATMRAMEMVMNCIGLLLGLIGVSNTLSAVSHTMMRRRREFAMLRSVGMDERGVGRLIALEGVRMAISPVLMALTAVAVLLQLLMGFLDVSWREFLPWIPWGKVLAGVLAVMAAVAVSYMACAGRIRKDTIIEAVRDENV